MNPQSTHFRWEHYFAQLPATRVRALLLDYDGTLAPFRVARAAATPDRQVLDALRDIIGTSRTRVVLVSGRALSDLVAVLRLDPLPELWGCHGWERRLPTGEYHGPVLPSVTREALDQALADVLAMGLAERVESKPASVAVHWRGMDPESARQLERRVRAAWKPLPLGAGLGLCEFDGGVELLALGRDKGYAVAQILRELDQHAAVAYAGDDRTDEHAFRALAGRGLSILVAPEPRPTAANVHLTPADFARFLHTWAIVDRGGTLT